MFKTLSFPILFILSFQGSNVIAQETSNRVAAQSDWAVFVGEGPKECWAVSVSYTHLTLPTNLRV